MMEHAVIDSDDGQLQFTNLPPTWQQQMRQILDAKVALAAANPPGSPADDLGESDLTSDDSGIRRLVGALVRNNHNRTKAAQELGVSRMTVYNLMKRFGFQ